MLILGGKAWRGLIYPVDSPELQSNLRYCRSAVPEGAFPDFEIGSCYWGTGEGSMEVD